MRVGLQVITGKRGKVYSSNWRGQLTEISEAIVWMPKSPKMITEGAGQW